MVSERTPLEVEIGCLRRRWKVRIVLFSSGLKLKTRVCWCLCLEQGSGVIQFVGVSCEQPRVLDGRCFGLIVYRVDLTFVHDGVFNGWHSRCHFFRTVFETSVLGPMEAALECLWVLLVARPLCASESIFHFPLVAARFRVEFIVYHVCVILEFVDVWVFHVLVLHPFERWLNWFECLVDLFFQLNVLFDSKLLLELLGHVSWVVTNKDLLVHLLSKLFLALKYHVRVEGTLFHTFLQALVVELV